MTESGIKHLKIGSVTLKSNLILAPLAGFTDVAYRRLCREYGAGLTVTEMVSVKGLYYGSANTAALLKLADNETPSCVQLFGSEPALFTRVLESAAISEFDIVDINMGCPMPKVTRNGDGSALLKDVARAAAVTEAAAKSGKPVTVKMRIGFDNNAFDYVGFARALFNGGASMITVHGRTTAQLYGGTADWDAIGKIAAALPIPVVGNGDVKTRADAFVKMRGYGVAGVMIGRGALGNPEIFSPSAAGDGTARQTVETLLKHLSYMSEEFPERYTAVNIRKHIPYYFKGITGIKTIKQQVNSAETVSALVEILRNIL